MFNLQCYNDEVTKIVILFASDDFLPGFITESTYLEVRQCVKTGCLGMDLWSSTSVVTSRKDLESSFKQL